MGRTALNYSENGGDKTIIGGELDITGTLKINGNTVTIADNQSSSTAENVADLVADFNELLSKLKAAGLMAPDA